MNQFKSAPNKDLTELRCEIDKLDHEILNLLAQRSETVQKIGSLKLSHKISAYDNDREIEIIEKVAQNNPTEYQAIDLANIFHAILRASLNLQLLNQSEYKKETWN